jgi:hypothetical protein
LLQTQENYEALACLRIRVGGELNELLSVAEPFRDESLLPD